jgi:hypothetical protein
LTQKPRSRKTKWETAKGDEHNRNEALDTRRDSQDLRVDGEQQEAENDDLPDFHSGSAPISER